MQGDFAGALTCNGYAPDVSQRVTNSLGLTHAATDVDAPRQPRRVHLPFAVHGRRFSCSKLFPDTNMSGASGRRYKIRHEQINAMAARGNLRATTAARAHTTNVRRAP